MTYLLHLEAFGGLRECNTDDVKIDTVNFGPAMRLAETLMPGLADGLKADASYTYMLAEAADLVAPDVYEEWREKMREIMHGKRPAPLSLLTRYSGAEGVFGPAACRTLNHDLKAISPRVRIAVGRMRTEGGLLFLTILGAWVRALETAGQNGAILLGLKPA